MKSTKITVMNKEGLHARPATLIVQCASQFESNIYLAIDDEQINAKSIMNLIGVNAVFGSQVTLMADGVDEQQALVALEQLFISKFGEE